jgi:hypothetical protein
MTESNPAGRPKIEVDWSKVDKSIQAQCPLEEVAGAVGVSVDTLVLRIKEKDGGIYPSFTAYAVNKKAEGKFLLRAKQYQQAMNGNTRMLDKLGDVYLGQARKEIEVPPNHEELSSLHQDLDENKSLKEQLEKLKKEFDAFKSQTNPVISTSDQTI